MSKYKSNVSVYLDSAHQIALYPDGQGEYSNLDAIELFIVMRQLQKRHKCGIELFDPNGFCHKRINPVPFVVPDERDPKLYPLSSLRLFQHLGDEGIPEEGMSLITLGDITRVFNDAEMADMVTKCRLFADTPMITTFNGHSRTYSYIASRLPFKPCIFAGKDEDASPYMALVPTKPARKGQVCEVPVTAKANHYSLRIDIVCTDVATGYTNIGTGADSLLDLAVRLSNIHGYTLDIFIPDGDYTDSTTVIMQNIYGSPYLALLPTSGYKESNRIKLA